MPSGLASVEQGLVGGTTLGLAFEAPGGSDDFFLFALVGGSGVTPHGVAGIDALGGGDTVLGWSLGSAVGDCVSGACGGSVGGTLEG